MRSATQQHILIVEDSKTYASALKRKIRQRLPFRISVATNFSEAKEFIDKYKDLIFLAVLDLHLPDAPHGEIVDYVLSRKLTAIVLTGTYSEVVREAMISKNVVDYVVKERAQDIDYIVNLIQRIRRNQSIKLLAVDDSATYRHMLRNYLNAHKYRVFEAKDGVEALEVLSKHPDIQMVVTDNSMPRMDGFELITYIRKDYSKDQLAVIGLSAQGAGSVSAKFLKKGANDFLYKPFSKEEFFCRISQNIEMLEMVREVQGAASRDALTGLYNKRYFFDLGMKFYERAKRKRMTLAVAVIDLDFLQGINDSFGHGAGDMAIKKLAVMLDEALRKTDIIARIDEQFCVLAPDMEPEGVQDLFDRLRHLLAQTTISYKGKTFGMTVSIGVTTSLHESLDGMVKAAENMLYLAKENGRNRVEIQSLVSKVTA